MVFDLLDEKLQEAIKKRFEKPTLTQELAIPKILERKNVLICAPVASGKCVGGDTIVLVEDGFKEIKELYQKEIRINGIGNQLKSVIKKGKVIRKRKCVLYEVETQSGRSIKATRDHKFLVLENGNLVWKELKKLRKNDYIACVRKINLIPTNRAITLDLFLQYKRIAVKTSPSVSEIIEKIKKKYGFGLRRIAKLVGCSRQVLKSAKRGKNISMPLLLKLIKLINLSPSSIVVKEIGCPGGKTIKVPILNEDFAYCVGLLMGDGNLNQWRNVRFSNSSTILVKYFKEFLEKMGLKLMKDKSRKYDYYLMCKSLVILLDAIGFNKEKDRIPFIFLSNYSLLSSFLSGLFDADGSSYTRALELVNKNERLAKEILQALSCFGIFAYLKRKFVKNRVYYRILIQDSKNKELFIRNVGFRVKSKQKKLISSIKRRYHTNVDIIPNIKFFLKKCREKLNVPYSHDKIYHLYENYAYGKENPSREVLKKIVKYLKFKAKKNPNIKEINLLEKLCDSDIFWDRVIKIRRIGKDFVYDATVPKLHNFIGNGIVLHNTEAGIFPVLNFIIKEKLKPIAALYITPLRALNRDMLERLIWWCNELGLDIGVRHSDTTAYERKLQAEFPTHLLILTPETLQAILPGKKMRKHLANVKFVVIDELHELIDSKRGVQLTIGLERLKEITGGFQVIGLSATIGSPEQAAKFISPQEEIEIIKVSFPKKFEIKVISPKPKEIDKKLALKIFSSKETSARLREVIKLIKESRATLVFTNTREFAEILASRIKILKKDFPIEVHHSSLSREVRTRVEKEFKQEKIKSLVATSSLELGIDIGAIEQVIQYMSPRQVTQALQRIGRSGHVLEKVSKGKIIATDEDDIFESAVIARKALAEELEKIKFYEKSLDVLAHQIIGLTLDFGRINVEKAFEIVKKAYPYKNLSFDEFLSVCKQLEKLGLIWLNP